MGDHCRTVDVLDFTTEVAGTQKVRVLVTIESECLEASGVHQIVYTVTNDATANTNVSSLSVAGNDYLFDVATANQVLPGQVGTVTVTRPGAECKVTSEAKLTFDYPTLGLGGVQYAGICVCALIRACSEEDRK